MASSNDFLGDIGQGFVGTFMAVGDAVVKGSKVVSDAVVSGAVVGASVAAEGAMAVGKVVINESDKVVRMVGSIQKVKAAATRPPLEVACTTCRFRFFRRAISCPRCGTVNELNERRMPIVGGNWKCNPSTVSKLDGLVANFNKCDTTGCEVYLCPTSAHLSLVAAKLTKKTVELCPQNCNFTGCGAYTGEISVEILRDLGCGWVLIGHSERRTLFGETDALLATKLGYVLERGFKCVFAIGETLAERQGGKTMSVCIKQLEKVAPLLHPDKVVIAYEPVWAIGTGVTASPQQAQETHAQIRAWLASTIGTEYARYLRIQYGGSANDKNAPDLSAMPDIDGFLVGGASLKPEFVDIVSAISTAKLPAYVRMRSLSFIESPFTTRAEYETFMSAAPTEQAAIIAANPLLQ